MDRNGTTSQPVYTTADRGAGRGTSAVAWIALLLALLALSLAWMAYNRTGADLSDRIRQEVNQSAQSAEDATQEASDEIQQGANQTENAIDAGPDGVDSDDTDTGGGTNGTNQNMTQ